LSGAYISPGLGDGARTDCYHSRIIQQKQCKDGFVAACLPLNCCLLTSSQIGLIIGYTTICEQR
ncbi:MAG: hypothetical protein KZQ82_02540, partial [Candidatus Thiodiazotropha sp. (ex Lucinoma annulata)]|nr:hypothetical protein [Candidatus Thiodiazotropha sp. (ex Lucinoma annulata)]